MNSVLLLLGLHCAVSAGYDILIYHDMGTKSHLIQLYPIVEKLLDSGHKVTGIYFNSAKIKHENYTEILIENPFEAKMAEISKMFMEKGGTSILNLKLWQASWAAWSESIEDMSMLPWRHPQVSQLINTGRQFDAVMTLGLDAFLADVFNCTLITWSPAGPVPMFMSNSGNVINLSVQPMVMSKYIEPMTFFQRVGNHLLAIVSEVYVRYFLYKMNGIRTAELGYELRSEKETMEERFSVFISNHHPVTHGSWPYLPNVVEVGGLGIKEAKPLTGDLRTFLDSAIEGAVYVSFGSAIPPSQMPAEKLELLLTVFKSLPQYSFVWKWDSEIENLPGNVKTKNWIPQQDLLGHPNLRVFVTHGGMGGVSESIYHKTALVGIPFVNDQKANLLRAERHGYARLLEWDELTAEDLKAAIVESMESREMQEALERVHRLYTDREMKPVERAVWWIEYVCRHQGADILRSIGENVPFYQYHHLDIVLFVLAILIVLVTIFVFTCKLCCKCCCSSKKTKKD